MSLKDAVARHVEGWVVKRDTDASPRRIEPADIDFLCEAIERESHLPVQRAEEALSAAFSGWLVQRARGERPGAIGMQDLRAFMAFAPAGHEAPEPPVPVDAPAAVQQPDQRAKTHEPMDLTGEELASRKAQPETVPAPARSLPDYDLMAGLDMARFHIEHGV